VTDYSGKKFFGIRNFYPGIETLPIVATESAAGARRADATTGLTSPRRRA